MRKILLVFLIFLAIFSAGCIQEKKITNFQECLDAGYPVMESYPRQCITIDGQTFIEEICEDKCGDGICNEIVCMGAGCPCPETKETCPNDCKGEVQMNRTAIIETTKGTMKLELFETKAPITTKNFIDLAEQGFYNGTIFHRVIEDFMIQGGDPTGTGTGGPGYTIQDEFNTGLKHDSIGILSMANTGFPNTGGSQFFITLEPTPWLDGKHSVFGKLTEGLDVLKEIGNTETDENDKPLNEIKIISILIQ